MILRIKKRKIDFWTVVMSAYLINQFYLNTAITIQKIMLWVILFLYVFKNFGYIKSLISRKKMNTINISLLAFGFWILVVIITPFLHGSEDYSYISYCLTYFSWTLYMLAIVIRIKKKYPYEDIFENFLTLFSISIMLYVLSTVLILVIPSLRNLVEMFVYNDEYSLSILQKEKYYTRIGWAGFSGYTMSLKCTISVCFTLYLSIRSIIKKNKVQYKLLILYLFSMLGNVFYARTGLVASLICTFIAVIYLAIRLGKLWMFIKYSLVIFCFCLGVLYFISVYSEQNVVLNWIFELFIGGFGGDIHVITLDIIFNQMLFMPENKTLIFGDGYYTGMYGLSYMRTDLGFLRLILYFGLPFTLFIYALYTYILKKISSFGKLGACLLGVLLFISFLFFEFKGESIIIFLPLAFVLLIISKSSYNSNEG